MPLIANPFRPGAGHQPPYLAGRGDETRAFRRLLEQEIVLDNMLLTGLRGVGKTVLLESFKPLAISNGWLWAGTDLTESTTLGEDRLAIRLYTDLSLLTSSITFRTERTSAIGFSGDEEVIDHRLTYEALTELHSRTPGLTLDKIKEVVETCWRAVGSRASVRGIVFAYDEAQNLADRASVDQFPLSLLLDAFQSLQRKEIPVLLVLSGLPTLFPKLVAARTFAERMFNVVSLARLSRKDSRDAIVRPVEGTQGSVRLSDESVETIIKLSGGYPYFIQFICREVYDAFSQRRDRGASASVPVEAITRKLDADFFSGRWSRTTDRQRELMYDIAYVLQHKHDDVFTVAEVVKQSRRSLHKPFGSSHVNQILASLSGQGLIHRNGHGRYSFSLPLLGDFILRDMPPGLL